MNIMLKYFLLTILALGLYGCGLASFEPYDYLRSEDAKLGRGNYALKLHGKELKLEKKLPVKKHYEQLDDGQSCILPPELQAEHGLVENRALYYRRRSPNR